MNQAIVTVRNLAVEIEQKHILKNVNLEAYRGKVLGIIGESGSGKTLTCKAIMGMLPQQAKITNGEIIHQNHSELGRTRGNQISIIMQNPTASFNPVRTIEKHFIETIRQHQKMSKKEARELAIFYMEKVHLSRPEDLLKQYPFQLSGGMLQRIMIAISMATKLELLIADEPTTALDTVNQKNILNELDRIRTELGVAIILVTQDLGVIAALADDVAVMYKARLLSVLTFSNYLIIRNMIIRNISCNRGL